MMVIKFAYVGEFTSRRRRVGVGEFARRRVDRIPPFSLLKLSVIGSLSSESFEPRMASKSDLFSSLTCRQTTAFIL